MMPGPKPLPIEERLRRHFQISEHGCWLWTGATTNGYGRFFVGSDCRFAHRVSYELFVGPIPHGLQIDHLCRNRACVNPQHLEAVTPKVNVLRSETPGANARRRTHCLNGHAYAEHGKEWRGRRICRQCNKDYCRDYQRRLREARQQRRHAA